MKNNQTPFQNICDILNKYWLFVFEGQYLPSLPIPLAERSKASVFGLSLAGIAGSNPAEDMDVCLL